MPLSESTAAVPGDTVTLECQVSLPDAASTWFKDDFELLADNDDKYDVLVAGLTQGLTIRDVTEEDEGEYTIEVGKDRSSSVLFVEGVCDPLNPRQGCFFQ